MKRLPFRTFCILLLASTAACNFSVNRTVRIEDGESHRGSINTVNGAIIIGDRCEVRGNCRSVNGRITVGRKSQVQELQTVNGAIRIDKEVTVGRDVDSVNGSITCESGVNVAGSINSINGRIRVYGTVVERDITTINGNITLSDRSRVKGDIIVKDNKGSSGRPRRLKIRLEDRSLVEGDIIVRDEDIEVEVILTRGSKVLGRIENAEVIDKSR